MLKLIKISFLFLFFQITSNNSFACTCWYNEPVFCREVNIDEHVIKVVIEEFYSLPHHDIDHQMRVKILENIHLNTTHDTLLVKGHNGLSCDEILNQFNLLDTLIIGVPIWNDASICHLNGCGLSFLKFQNDTIYGQITDDLTVQHIDAFKANLFTCLDLETPIEELGFDENGIKIYPNPFINQVTIEANEVIQKVELSRSDGKIIQSIQPNKNFEIVLNHFEKNQMIYFLRIVSDKGILTKKLFQIPE